MPLLPGKSEKVIQHNIGELIAAGHAPKQAAAIAYANARKYGLRDPGYPKKASARKRQKHGQKKKKR